MGMQLLLHIWYQRKHLFTLVHINCFCTESKIKFQTTDTSVMHMATPTMIPVNYTTQTQEIPSILSKNWNIRITCTKLVLHLFGDTFDCVCEIRIYY